jgi:hypothetical protein
LAQQAKAEQIDMFKPKSKKSCNCKQYKTCTTCRNAHRKQLAKIDERDALRAVMESMPPDVLAICLEVRAMNRSKRAAAIAATD